MENLLRGDQGGSAPATKQDGALLSTACLPVEPNLQTGSKVQEVAREQSEVQDLDPHGWQACLDLRKRVDQRPPVGWPDCYHPNLRLNQRKSYGYLHRYPNATYTQHFQ